VIVNNQQDFVYNAGKGATDEASRLTFDQSWEQSGLFDIEQDYPRDLIGYGRNRPRPVWPREARVAVQFVISYEEGGESMVMPPQKLFSRKSSERSRGRGSGTST